MKTILLIVFGLLSICVGLVSFYSSIKKHKIIMKKRTVLSAVQLYTIGIFISVVLVFIPIYYTSYNFGDRFIYIRPFLLSVHNSLRVFILDGDFDIVKNALKDQSTILSVCYSLYSAFLYIIAPILTFSNVLLLFKNVKGEMRYYWHRCRPHYIMSELNVKSVALAKSIYKKKKKAVIVFTDVFEQNEEVDYELLSEVRDINAICLKTDISHLNINSKKGNVELFLIGENEAENVSKAVKITTELNQKNSKHNVKIFVFSHNISSAYIIDSVRYDNLLRYAGEHEYKDCSFKLRRVNEIQQIVWNIVPEMKVFDTAQKNNNTLSVLIAGMGSYGFEFFKMLVWYCQFEGYKLQINIVDNQTDGFDGKRSVESIINRQFPDLLKMNKKCEDGESYYDVEIISGIDMSTADFAELALYEGEDEEKKRLSERLKKTSLAVVALGDDDLNIEVAVYLRTVFDRVYGVKNNCDVALEDEHVQIYSVVYDENKSGILHFNGNNSSETGFLVNHRGSPYNIHFVGGMSTQFDYDNIYNSDLESKSYKHHREWVSIEEKIYNEWLKAKKNDKIEKHYWSFEQESTDEARTNAQKKYEKYEYYRLSSIAKELYRNEVDSNSTLKELTVCTKGGQTQTCECENCVRRKKSEHMRWNAYTRINGFSYEPGIRADRARLHNDLCSWNALSELEKLKD